MNLTVYQKKQEGREDSFWYCGAIALLEEHNMAAMIVAIGDTTICDTEGNIVYHNHSIENPPIPSSIQNDDDLNNLEANGYHCEHGNWFAFYYKEADENRWHHYDDIASTYTEAIERAKSIIDEQKMAKTIGNAKHAYAGQLANTIDLEIEILVCGYCACWFAVDGDALVAPDVDLACPFCYRLAPAEEAAATPRQIHLWEEVRVVIEEVEQAIYNSGGVENQALDDALREPIPDLYDDRGGEYE